MLIVIQFDSYVRNRYSLALANLMMRFNLEINKYRSKQKRVNASLKRNRPRRNG